MKIILTSYFLLCFICDMFSQSNPNAVNLLQNGNFETPRQSYGEPGCYDYYSALDVGGKKGSGRFTSDLLDWAVARKCGSCFWGSPDWLDYQKCGDYLNNGNLTSYVHCSSDIENIRSVLIKNNSPYSLVPNTKYIIRYRYFNYSGSSNYTSGIRIFFTEKGYHWYSNINNDKYEAINANVSWTNDPSGWQTKYTSFIVPSGNSYNEMKNIIFRLHNDDGAEYTKFLIDDIELYEEETCADMRAIENTVYWNESFIYQAENILKAGYDVNNPLTDNGDVIVKYNSNIVYRAGQQVSLEPGFSTEQGAYFLAVIEPCEENPCPPPPSAPSLQQVCFGTPTNIGVSNAETGQIYSWSPATYLDNPNSPNPLFTPPAGEGSITYNVTVNSACNIFVTGIPFSVFTPDVQFQVTVYYNDNPNPNPTISLQNIQTSDYSFGFDATYGSQTQEICINFYESPSNTLAASYCLEALAEDFECCSLTINYEDLPDEVLIQLKACKDYTVEVTAKNFCYSNVATQSFFWDRNNTIQIVTVPNVISIANPITGNNNGVNDEFCIVATGADAWSLYVTNSWGSPVANIFGSVLSSPQCIWDGTCVGNGVSCTQGATLSEGVYYYVLEIVNRCNESDDEAGFVHIFHDPEYMPVINIFNTISSEDELVSNLLSSDNDDMIIKFIEQSIEVYPNPANEILNIKISPLLLEHIKTFSVKNTLGQSIYSANINKELNEVDLTNFSTGIYFVQIQTPKKNVIKKIVKQ